MENLIRALLLAKICDKVASADASEEYPVGTRFDFDCLADPRGATAREVCRKVLAKVSHIDYDKLLHFGPFEVVFVAKGAPADLVARDSEGDHFYIPSGLVHLLKLCEQGEYPPALPGSEDSESVSESDDLPTPEQLVSNLLEQLKKAA